MFRRRRFSHILVLQTALVGGVALGLALTFENSYSIAAALVLLLAFGSLIILLRSYLRRVRRVYRRRTQTILEVQGRRHRQQEALQKLATDALVQNGSLKEAFVEITELITQALSAEWVAIGRFSENRELLLIEDEFHSQASLHRSGAVIFKSVCADYFSQILNNQTVPIADLRNDASVKDVSLFREYDLRALLEGTIAVHGAQWGVLSIGSTQRPRTWRTDEQEFVRSVAEVIASVIENHKRNHLEKELAERSTAIESALDGIAIIDQDDRFIFVNAAYAQIYGYPAPGELLGRTWRELYTNEELLKFEQSFLPLLRSSGRMRVETSGMRKNGTLFPQELSLSTLPKGGLICVIRDISERKAIEAHALEMAVFATLDPSPLLRFNQEGKILMANPAACSLLNIREPISVFLHQSIPGLIDFNPRLCIEQGLSHTVKSQIGEKFFTFVFRGIPALKFGNVYGNDITELKRAEEHLVQSQKMDAIGHLAGGIAHDFNNLLTGILGYTSFLKMNSLPPDEVEHYATMIEKISSKAGQLTQKLLAFARKGKHQDIAVDVHTAIEDTCTIVGRTLPPHVTLATNNSAHKHVVRGDPVQIQQVVLNLAINAIDAMNPDCRGTEGGQLQITTRNEELRGGKNRKVFVGGGTLSPGDYLVISVQDQGCGVPLTVRDHIFEPFFTTKEVGKGTGMGLAMVYGIVKNHSGGITLHSVKPHGSLFEVYLPLAPSTLLTVEKVVDAPVKTRTQHTILFVDDNHEVCEVSSSMLRMLGYEVLTAESGEEAVQIYTTDGPRIDLVILDLSMPGISGRECFAELRKINPAVLAILSTGYLEKGSVQELEREGIKGFIQKPYQLHTLSEITTAILKKAHSQERIYVGSPLHQEI